MGRPLAAKALVASLFLCALLGAFLWSRPVALADDTELGATGGSVYPIRSADIRMAAETVQAVCFGRFAEYRVDFRFVNDGKARKVRLGFPFADTVSSEHGTERPVGFQAWQNGRPLTVRTVEARGQGKGWTHGYFVHEALLPHGSTVITVSYLSHASATATVRRRDVSPGDPGFGMASWYTYWLHTGSTWKGPIGEAVVRYRFADTFAGRDIRLTAAEALGDYVRVTAPPDWTRPLPRTCQWQFADFEPKPAHPSDWWEPESRFDVTLGFASPMRRRVTGGAWTWSSVAAERFGDKNDDNLQDGQLDSCWAEGVPGPGTGEWLEARFKRPRRLRELRILPGNNAYGSAFKRFARPRTLTAVFSDGSHALLRLKDAATLQRFPVNVTTRSVRLVIRSVYLGTDYPATCISEVEFGTQPAPGYAPFRRLIDDPRATGRLTAWAGRAAPAPRPSTRTTDLQEAQDAEICACGDLIGISDYEPFPADAAPFKEPASLAAIRAKDRAVTLPEPTLVGEPIAVNALSYRTYEIRYASGIDLLVNTRLTDRPRVSLLSELAEETRYMEPYTDHRKIPFDLVTVGHQVVGLGRPGTVSCSDCEDDARSVPGQVFWRDGDSSYHLYARAKAVTTDKLVAVARSLIEPRPGDTGGSGSAPSSSAAAWPRWVGAAAALAAVTVLVILFGLRKRRAAAPPAGTA